MRLAKRRLDAMPFVGLTKHHHESVELAAAALGFDLNAPAASEKPPIQGEIVELVVCVRVAARWENTSTTAPECGVRGGTLAVEWTHWTVTEAASARGMAESWTTLPAALPMPHVRCVRTYRTSTLRISPMRARPMRRLSTRQ